MSLSHLLVKRYFHSHRRQCVSIILCISLFVAALLTTLWYRSMSVATYEKKAWDQFGKDYGIVFNADPDLVSQGIEELHQSGGGAVYAMEELSSPDADRSYFVGYMDPQVMELRAVDLLEGSLPQTAGEIAIEQDALRVLFPGAKVGDTVTLPLQSNEQYRIAGILEPYQLQWRVLNGSKTFVNYPPPTILTIPNNQPIQYIHVFLADSSLAERFGGFFERNDMLNNPMVSSGNNTTDSIVAILFVLFAMVMVFGLTSIARFTLKEINLHILLLRCVGMTKKQAKKLFAHMGLLLWLITSAIGLVISLFLTWLIFLISKVFTDNMIWSLSLFSPLMCFALSLLVIMAVLLFPLKKIFHSAIVDTGKKKVKKAKRRRIKLNNMESVWHRATRANYFGQSLAVFLLSFLCVCIAVFGTAAVLVTPRIMHSSLLRGAYPENEDYVMYVRGGASEGENLYVTLPRKMGISQATLDQLKNTEGLHINSVQVGNMSIPFFLLESSINAHPYLLSLRDEGEGMDPNEVSPPSDSQYAISEEMVEPVRKAIAATGCTDSSAMLVEPSLMKTDYDTVAQLLPEKIISQFTKEDFVSGKIIIAPDTRASIGDTFQMVVPVWQSENEPMQFAASQVTVAATYDPADYMDHLLLSNGCMILSAEYLLSVDPSARYTEVSIQNLYKGDAEKRAQLEALIDQYAAAADNVSVENHIQEQEQYDETVRNGQLLIAGSLLIFLLILAVAISLSTSVKLRFNFQSYMLLRAIGAQDTTIWRLIRSDTLVPLLNGCLVGLPLSLILSMLILSDAYYVPVDDVFYIIIGAAVGISVLVCAVSFIAIRRPVKNMLKKSVVEEIRNTESN